MAKSELVLIAHDIRSIHNIGSLTRTADAFGITKIYATGYTPYLSSKDDLRPPHVKSRLVKEIHKTALGAEEYIDIEFAESLPELIDRLKNTGFAILALEQSSSSIPLASFIPKQKMALMVGPEVTGFSQSDLDLADVVLEIPMKGHKESLNVSVAGAIALYELCRKQLY